MSRYLNWVFHINSKILSGIDEEAALYRLAFVIAEGDTAAALSVAVHHI